MRFLKIPILSFVAIISLFCSFSFRGKTIPPGGEQLYRTYCSKCHGTDGSKGKAGKNKLDESILTPEAISLQIENGKKGMPAFKKKLTPDDVAAVTSYVITLRK